MPEDASPELVRWARLLAAPPDAAGGRAIVLATDSTPPAIALLTTSSIAIEDDAVRIVVQAGSTVARRPATSLTLVAEDGEATGRLEVTIDERRPAGDLVVLRGHVLGGRGMTESPWRLRLRFEPVAGGDPSRLLRYWNGLRAWLRDDASSPPPVP